MSDRAPDRGRERGERERGATLVEFAFVLPVLVLLLFGLADLCLVLIGNSVGSNAAREGARVGIIDYLGADVVGSDNNKKIVAAVNAKVAGLVRDGAVDSVTVRCFNGRTANPVVIPCRKTQEPHVDLTRGDLIEVEVRWRHLGATPFVANLTHTDRSRMVILGRPDTTNPAAPPVTPAVSIADVTVQEGNAGLTDAVFTISRTPTAGLVAVDWSTDDGTARSNGPSPDFDQASGTVSFLAGQATRTITVKVRGDTEDEPTETFAVNLSRPVGGRIVDGTAVGTIANDDSPADAVSPTVSSIRMLDGNVNGKVDRVVITFNEALGACPGTSGLSAAGVPSGGTLGGVAQTGSTATVSINEGAGAHDTAVGSFRLTLVANPSGFCDAAGNQASFPSTAPSDAAGPVVLSLADTNGIDDGRLDGGDSMSFTFSEAVVGLPASTTISEIDGNGKDDLDIPSITNARSDLGGGGYVTVPIARFNAGVTTSGNGRTVTVTAGSCIDGCSGLGSDKGRLAFTPSPGIRDPEGNSSTGSITTDNGFRAF